MTKQIKPSEWIEKHAMLQASHVVHSDGVSRQATFEQSHLIATIRYLDLLAEKHPEFFNLDTDE